MYISILIGLICIFFTKRFISKLEYYKWEYGHREWQDIKFPLWLWILIFIFLCLPIFGIVIYICGWVGAVISISSGNLRIKEGKSSLLIKLIEMLQKKY